MIHIEDSFIKDNVDYPTLIEALRLAFSKQKIVCPPKQVYDYKSQISNIDNTMLIMPAWDDDQYFGVKLISTTPSNKQNDIPYINGLYLLFDANTGVPFASMDAKLITHMRTAATSVLGAQYLLPKGATSVLIMGNGQIAPHFISAYDSLSEINHIYLWGRDYKKSQRVVDSLQAINASVEAVPDFTKVIRKVDVVSCITSARSPIVQTDHLRQGQHIDLAGSFTPEMIEVSTDVVARSHVYVDNHDVTPFHAGELVQAVNEGKLETSSIVGDLHSLCVDKTSKRSKDTDLTLFKSTGMAIEDFVIANMIMEQKGL
ncbi:MAG: ornithine cyclodeaminase/alanine dehydrogenase-like protein (mu-crystallin family) [Saprospiraceae bacterium]|jgi:ornithine cyclodeaminase/alanine dehydrogenase-like protein (mu-crystallin family)